MSVEGTNPIQSPASMRSPGRLRQWLNWWLSELWAALPESVRGRFVFSGAGVAVRLEKDQCSVLVVQSGQTRTVGSVSLVEGDAQGRKERLRALIEANGGLSDRVTLVMRTEDCVRRVVSLPAAAEEALAQVVGFELDRITPFNATQANYAARVVGRHDNGANIRVEVAAAPRAVITELLRRAGELGLVAQAVVPGAVEPSPPVTELDLLPQDSRTTTGLSGSVKLNIALAMVFLCLLAVALVLPIWQKREMVIAILPRLHNANVEAEKVVKTRDELEQLAKDANFILAKKHAQVPVTQLMEDLAANFSDSTWVAALEFKSGKQRELVLTGETAAATKVVEVLEQLKYLKNPTFRSPITRVPGQVAEKFVIAVEVHPRPLPAGADDLLEAAPSTTGSPPQPAVAAPAPQLPPANVSPAPSPSPVQTRPVAPANPAGNSPSTGKGDKTK